MCVCHYVNSFTKEFPPKHVSVEGLYYVPLKVGCTEPALRELMALLLHLFCLFMTVFFISIDDLRSDL